MELTNIGICHVTWHRVRRFALIHSFTHHLHLCSGSKYLCWDLWSPKECLPYNLKMEPGKGSGSDQNISFLTGLRAWLTRKPVTGFLVLHAESYLATCRKTTRPPWQGQLRAKRLASRQIWRKKELKLEVLSFLAQLTKQRGLSFNPGEAAWWVGRSATCSFQNLKIFPLWEAK